MDTAAGYLKQLQDAHIPVLWRPMHENNGTFFWWGGRPGQYGTAQLYREVYNRMVNVHHLNNLVWVWNQNGPAPGGEFYSFYPGAQYCDVVSYDNYSALDDRYYQEILTIANGKPIALGEVGTPPPPEVLASPAEVGVLHDLGGRREHGRRRGRWTWRGATHAHAGPRSRECHGAAAPADHSGPPAAGGGRWTRRTRRHGVSHPRRRQHGHAPADHSTDSAGRQRSQGDLRRPVLHQARRSAAEVKRGVQGPWPATDARIAMQTCMRYTERMGQAQQQTVVNLGIRLDARKHRRFRQYVVREGAGVTRASSIASSTVGSTSMKGAWASPRTCGDS